ncbi:hypothetical protein [Microbacterium sp. PA5]|uniref:hypothetical protein n=1 Tax=Microbacterium sp. PA5 TaxID=3416654 RepID=UPI003CE75646
MNGWGWVAAALLLLALDLEDGIQWWPVAIILAIIGALRIAADTRRRLAAIDEVTR